MGKVSEAQKRANKKYALKTYCNFTFRMRKELHPRMAEYMKLNDCDSKNRIVLSALKYCMDNNIDLSEYIKPKER